MIGYLRVPALLGTFVTSIIALGFNYLVGGGSSIRITKDVSGDFFLSLGSGYLFGIPVPFIIAVFIIAILILLLERTKWGLRMYAVGGNRDAAVVFGINTRKMKMLAFIISGITSSLAGLLLAARLGAGSPIAGDAYTLDAIAATFVGVSMFREGEPHIVGTILGVLIMGILVNGMRLLGIGYELQIILRGLFILAAVATAGKRALFRTKLF
jgi:ribose transport system permease protein